MDSIPHHLFVRDCCGTPCRFALDTEPPNLLQEVEEWITGKSLSEVLIFVSTNPQYDHRLFNKLRVQYMKVASSEHGENMLCTQIVFVLTFTTTFVHNMFYPCTELVIQ